MSDRNAALEAQVRRLKPEVLHLCGGAVPLPLCQNRDTWTTGATVSPCALHLLDHLHREASRFAAAKVADWDAKNAPSPHDSASSSHATTPMGATATPVTLPHNGSSHEYKASIPAAPSALKAKAVGITPAHSDDDTDEGSVLSRKPLSRQGSMSGSMTQRPSLGKVTRTPSGLGTPATRTPVSHGLPPGKISRTGSHVGLLDLDATGGHASPPCGSALAAVRSPQNASSPGSRHSSRRASLTPQPHKPHMAGGGSAACPGRKAGRQPAVSLIPLVEKRQVSWSEQLCTVTMIPPRDPTAATDAPSGEKLVTKNADASRPPPKPVLPWSDLPFAAPLVLHKSAKKASVADHAADDDEEELVKQLTLELSLSGDLDDDAGVSASSVGGDEPVPRRGRPAVPLRGLRILDLGSGTGVVGLGLAAFGATVTLSDDQERIALLRRNVDEFASSQFARHRQPNLDGAAFTKNVTGATLPALPDGGLPPAPVAHDFNWASARRKNCNDPAPTAATEWCPDFLTFDVLVACEGITDTSNLDDSDLVRVLKNFFQAHRDARKEHKRACGPIGEVRPRAIVAYETRDREIERGFAAQMAGLGLVDVVTRRRHVAPGPSEGNATAGPVHFCIDVYTLAE